LSTRATGLIQLRPILDSFVAPLTPWQRVTLAALMGISLSAGIALGLVTRRALRDASGIRRLSGWGWNIRMLRRSYYPPSGQHLHSTIVRLYTVSMAGIVAVFLLLVAWVVL